MVGPMELDTEINKEWIVEKEQTISKVVSSLYHNAWHTKVLMPKLIPLT
jgi:hypothetical protein